MRATSDTDPLHPLTSGFRAMLLPFVVSPLAVAAALQDSLTASDWGGRWAAAGAFALVAVIDAACAVAFAPLLGERTRASSRCSPGCSASCSRAVGVQLFLDGLATLGVLHTAH